MIAPQFPRVRAACEASRQVQAQHADPTTRREDILARAAAIAAAEQARDAYAGELLPAIFGGAWRLSTRHPHWPARIFGRGKASHHSYGRWTLFDHGLVFRARGTRGPDTYKNCAVIGRPYTVPSAWLRPGTGAAEEAAALFVMGLGVWWRPDLSTWNPPKTQLILCAQGLRADDAARFGFEAVQVMS